MKKLLKKLLPRRSKQGVTLVESVIAVVVLGMFATGVLSLLTTGGAKILEISGESAAYAAATQELDLIIAAISNGAVYVEEDETDGSLSLNTAGLASALGCNDTDIGYTASSADSFTIDGWTISAEYDGMKLTAKADLYDSTEPAEADNIRGWYLTLENGGEKVTGFAGNNKGVFDQ